MMKKYSLNTASYALIKAVFEQQQQFDRLDLKTASDSQIVKEIQRRGLVFLNPLSDHGFKRGFCADDKATPEMTGLINSILQQTGRPLLEQYAFLNNEMKGEALKQRDAVFDARFIDLDGRNISVEMQQWYVSHMLNRTSFYMSHAEVNSVKKGKLGDDFKAGPFLSIAFTNFVLFKDKPCLVEIVEGIKGTTDQVTDRRCRIIIQLPKFKKDISELESDFDKFLFLMINIGKMKEIPPEFDNDKFGPLFEKLRIGNFNIQQMRNYIASEKAGELLRLRLEGAEEIGMERGIEKNTLDVIRNLASNTLMTKEEIANAIVVPLELVDRVIKEMTSKLLPTD